MSPLPDLEPLAWLRRTPPFDALPRALFEAATARLEIGFWGAGHRLSVVDGRPLEHLYVIRTGSVRLERDGQLVQLLEEGETFGHTSLVTGEAALDVVVEAPLLAYRIPAADLARLLEDAHFAGHFADGLAERLRSSLARGPAAPPPGDLGQPVGGLVRRPPVWIAAEATAGEAARRMRDERVTCVLVRGDPPGIVTARDFRSRVLAEGLGPEVPLARLRSAPLRTVDAAAPIHEAWTVLLEAGVHHLPVVRAGEIAGVVTSTDLLRLGAVGPIAVLRQIEALATREAVRGHAERLAEVATGLLAGGLDAPAIGALAARLDAALLRRVAELAEADLGPAPAPWAWVAVGAEGRRERALPGDQDHALVYADAGAAHRGWYAAFAERVSADLEAAGIPPCPGGWMATRRQGTLTEWMRKLAGWLERPTPEAILDAATFLDYRPVAGALALAPLDEIRSQARERPVFLRWLARAALDFRPPPALLLSLRSDAGVDLKAQALQPVVALARCLGLEAGATDTGTLARLEAAARAGVADEELAAAAGEAFRFLAGLRLRAQLAARAVPGFGGARLALADLSAVERTRLKEALRVVRRFQERAGARYRSDL